MSAQVNQYNESFFAKNVQSSTPSAHHVLGILYGLYQPESVVDIGCEAVARLTP